MLEKEVRIFQVRLKILRKEKGLTQAELYRSTKIDHGYICKLETGKRTNPTYKIMLRLCEALDCNLFDLTGK